MPGSSMKGKSVIYDWFQSLPIRSVLDVGPGWGTYSKLLRKTYQLWHAVEIHSPYIERFQLNRYYDEIYITDIRSFIPTRCYDVIICGDVLEHMANDEATAVLAKLLNYAEYIIVSLPLEAETNTPQGTGDVDWNNLYELHGGEWSHELFVEMVQSFKAHVVDYKRYPEIAVYLIASK